MPDNLFHQPLAGMNVNIDLNGRMQSGAAFVGINKVRLGFKYLGIEKTNLMRDT